MSILEGRPPKKPSYTSQKPHEKWLNRVPVLKSFVWYSCVICNYLSHLFDNGGFSTLEAFYALALRARCVKTPLVLKSLQLSNACDKTQIMHSYHNIFKRLGLSSLFFIRFQSFAFFWKNDGWYLHWNWNLIKVTINVTFYYIIEATQQVVPPKKWRAKSNIYL